MNLLYKTVGGSGIPFLTTKQPGATYGQFLRTKFRGNPNPIPEKYFYNKIYTAISMITEPDKYHLYLESWGYTARLHKKNPHQFYPNRGGLYCANLLVVIRTLTRLILPSHMRGY